MRRNSINGFFFNVSIRRVESIIKKRLKKMLSWWSEASSENGKILYLHTVFKAYASDIIITYAFGDCFHFLDENDWGMTYFDSTEKYFGLTHVFGHFPIVMKLVNNASTWALRLIIDDLFEMSEKQEVRALTFTSLHNFIPLSVSKRLNLSARKRVLLEIQQKHFQISHELMTIFKHISERSLNVRIWVRARSGCTLNNSANSHNLFDISSSVLLMCNSGE